MLPSVSALADECFEGGIRADLGNRLIFTTEWLMNELERIDFSDVPGAGLIVEGIVRDAEKLKAGWEDEGTNSHYLLSKLVPSVAALASDVFQLDLHDVFAPRTIRERLGLVAAYDIARLCSDARNFDGVVRVTVKASLRSRVLSAALYAYATLDWRLSGEQNPHSTSSIEPDDLMSVEPVEIHLATYSRAQHVEADDHPRFTEISAAIEYVLGALQRVRVEAVDQRAVVTSEYLSRQIREWVRDNDEFPKPVASLDGHMFAAFALIAEQRPASPEPTTRRVLDQLVGDHSASAPSRMTTSIENAINVAVSTATEQERASYREKFKSGTYDGVQELGKKLVIVPATATAAVAMGLAISVWVTRDSLIAAVLRFLFGTAG